jgi:hypothetical protein
MSQFKIYTDPLGNTVLFPLNFTGASHTTYEEVSKVVTDPSFLIRGKKRKLYFFRLSGAGVTMLVEARMIKDQFEVKACVQNPSREYISILLRKGPLLSFII